MKKKNKLVALMMALMLLVGAAVGGTIAWLVTNTNPVVNTFTAGDISITLTESDSLDLKMVPGKDVTKDPKVTVKANSEDCWVFIKVDESNVTDFLSYSVDETKWTALSGVDGVYYREVSQSSSDQSFYVLTNNQVTVINTVTKEQLNGLTSSTYPTLTFTAYAIQKEGFGTASAAWAEASKIN